MLMNQKVVIAENKYDNQGNETKKSIRVEPSIARAKKGVVAGAYVSSIVPGIGTALGALVGGFFGAIFWWILCHRNEYITENIEGGKHDKTLYIVG